MEAETRARTKYAIGVVASEVFGATIAGGHAGQSAERKQRQHQSREWDALRCSSIHECASSRRAAGAFLH